MSDEETIAAVTLKLANHLYTGARVKTEEGSTGTVTRLYEGIPGWWKVEWDAPFKQLSGGPYVAHELQLI